ncbi:MAG TPA: serine hydrolase [Marinagarivorans sp.]
MIKSNKWRYSLIAALVFVVLAGFSVTIFAYRAGYTPRYIAAAPAMLVGFSAKMSCSLHYVSDLPKAQVHRDIVSYSSLFGLPSVDYDDAERRVTASFLWEDQQAQFRDGVGCTLVESGQVLPPVTYRPEPKLSQPLDAQTAHAFAKPSAALAHKLQALINADQREQHDTRALLVMRANGDVLAQAYAEGYNAQTLFLGWSLSKTLTASWIGNLQYRKLIPPLADHSPDSGKSQHAAALFREWRDDARQQISLRHLFTMTSGLGFSEIYEPGSDATKMLFEDASSSMRPLNSALVNPSGGHWRYSSGTANLLSLYGHRALGGQPNEVLGDIHSALLQPLAMGRAVLELDREGVFVGSSFMFATAKAWANLGALYLNLGVFNGERLLDSAWVEQALAPNSSSNDSRYGFQLWLNQGAGEQPLRWPSLPPSSFAAQGNRGQTVMVLPKQGLVIVRLGWGKPKYPVDKVMAHIVALVADLDAGNL